MKNIQIPTKLQKPNQATNEVNSKRKAQAIDFKLKYKTELCKKFESGFCEFGEACAFAHGQGQLRKVTKECFQFAQNGFCTYGDRCQFVHTEEPQTSANSTVNSGASSRRNSIDDVKPRLPIFIELEKRTFNH